MTLIKTSLLNGIAVIIKMMTLLCSTKVLAIYVGPTGYAALGQFQNVLQIITTFASGAITTGVTKYTAEYYDDEERQHLVWRTAGTIAFVGSLITSIVIAIYSQPLAIWLLKDSQYSGVFLWFAGTLVFFTLNSLLLAILNGKKEIRRYVIINILGSIFSLIVTISLAIKFGLYGALVSLAIYQSIAFLVTLLLCYKAQWFKLSYLFGRIDRHTALNLGKYTVMALTTAACVPVSQIIIRNHLGEVFGWEAAGYWEAMSRLSNAYLMVITTTLAVYYLPKLSELTKASEIKHEIIQGYKLILPVVALGGLTIYLCRDLIISLLFTKDFVPMRDLFAWQMIGDTLKIGSWILAYLMLGKAMIKLFIITEILSSFGYVLLTWILTSYMGIQGVVLAFALTYAIYWLIMFWFIWRQLDQECDNPTIP